jgi:hypothetical protein
MDKHDFSTLMDQVIVRTLLPGNSAATPRKKVQIMVCADFEDSSDPQEKFYHWTPVHMTDLPPFKLCDQRYWEENANNGMPDVDMGDLTPQEIGLENARQALGCLQ